MGMVMLDPWTEGGFEFSTGVVTLELASGLVLSTLLVDDVVDAEASLELVRWISKPDCIRSCTSRDGAGAVGASLEGLEDLFFLPPFPFLLF